MKFSLISSYTNRHIPSVNDGAVVVAAFGVAKESEGVGKADAAVDAAAGAAPRLKPELVVAG